MYASTLPAVRVAAEPLEDRSGNDRASLVLQEGCPLPNIAVPETGYASVAESPQLINTAEGTVVPSMVSGHTDMFYRGASPSVREAQAAILPQSYPPALLQAAVEYLKSQMLDHSRSDAVPGREVSSQFEYSMRDAPGPTHPDSSESSTGYVSQIGLRSESEELDHFFGIRDARNRP